MILYVPIACINPSVHPRIHQRYHCDEPGNFQGPSVSTWIFSQMSSKFYQIWTWGRFLLPRDDLIWKLLQLSSSLWPLLNFLRYAYFFCLHFDDCNKCKLGHLLLYKHLELSIVLQCRLCELICHKFRYNFLHQTCIYSYFLSFYAYLANSILHWHSWYHW